MAQSNVQAEPQNFGKFLGFWFERKATFCARWMVACGRVAAGVTLPEAPPRRRVALFHAEGG